MSVVCNGSPRLIHHAAKCLRVRFSLRGLFRPRTFPWFLCTTWRERAMRTCVLRILWPLRRACTAYLDAFRVLGIIYGRCHAQRWERGEGRRTPFDLIALILLSPPPDAVVQSSTKCSPGCWRECCGVVPFSSDGGKEAVASRVALLTPLSRPGTDSAYRATVHRPHC